MKLPKVTSTTELVRNITILTEAPSDQLQIITKGKNEIGVYVPMQLFQRIANFDENATNLNIPSLKVNLNLRKKIRSINSQKLQQQLRSEY